MNKSLLTGAVLGAVVATAGATLAGLKLWDKEPTHAEVLAVNPVHETVKTPREVCHDEVITHTKPVQDPNRVTGTVAGAVVGGLLGNQIGGGSGKKIATAVGAVAGGYAGNKTQQRIQSDNTYTTTERRCKTVTDTSEELRGYDVSYRLGEEEGVVRMAHDPGPTIPVRDGRLVTE